MKNQELYHYAYIANLRRTLKDQCVLNYSYLQKLNLCTDYPYARSVTHEIVINFTEVKTS